MVTRYTPQSFRDADGDERNGEMDEDTHGDYVNFDEFDDLEKSKLILEKEVQDLRAALDDIKQIIKGTE